MRSSYLFGLGGLILGIAICASFFLGTLINKSKTNVLSETVQISPPPSATPTASASAISTKAPIAAPKSNSNSTLSPRLKELDSRIAAIKARIGDNNAYIDQLFKEKPEGYIYNVMGTQEANKELQDELNTLNAERTQILK